METNSFFDCCNDTLFQKNYSFEKNNDWVFSTCSEENVWHIDSLNILKQNLNATKSLLNDKGEDWHEHTAKINKASHVFKTIKNIVQPEILTQAWCKFYEILSNFNLFPTHKKYVKSLHLCEAPGAFISALNYYLCMNHSSTNWEWMANTLNPYYEGHNIRNVVVDDRLIFPTLRNWYFGEDNTGDITDPNYIDDICKLSEEIDFFDLITADGSVDCLDNPGEQESVVSKLHFAEVLIALSCLSPQGCFVLKKFTFFECITISQLFLLNCAFEKVHVFKPFTSRASNSEVYVICIGFHRSEVLSNILDHYKLSYRTKNVMSFFPKAAIPESFLLQLEGCMEYFTDLQISAIKDNLKLYPLNDDLAMQKLNVLKDACAAAFVEKYSIRSSSVYDSRKLYSLKKKVAPSFFDNTCRNHKSIYFQAVGDTFNNIKKSSYLQWHNKLQDVENRINVLFPVGRKRPYEEIEWQFPWKEIRKKMKSKTFQNWITSGKRISCIHNSKFCYPVLLYLWNQVSSDSKVDVQHHIASHCIWDLDILMNVLNEDPSFSSNIIAVSTAENCYENDPLLQLLKQEFNFKVSFHSNMDANLEVDLSVNNQIIYINTTVWVNSLHQECIVKKNLTEVFLNVLKVMRKGDTLLLCIQSVLTRYTIGLIFIIVSFFDKFTVILPENSAPACAGQIWIFKNFQDQKWLSNAVQLFEELKILNEIQTKDVLEIVPMSSLCSGAFNVYLRELNNKYLLQRLRNLIAVEKCIVEKSMNCT